MMVITLITEQVSVKTMFKLHTQSRKQLFSKPFQNIFGINLNGTPQLCLLSCFVLVAIYNRHMKEEKLLVSNSEF